MPPPSHFQFNQPVGQSSCGHSSKHLLKHVLQAKFRFFLKKEKSKLVFALTHNRLYLPSTFVQIFLQIYERMLPKQTKRTTTRFFVLTGQHRRTTERLTLHSGTFSNTSLVILNRRLYKGGGNYRSQYQNAQKRTMVNVTGKSPDVSHAGIVDGHDWSSHFLHECTSHGEWHPLESNTDENDCFNKTSGNSIVFIQLISWYSNGPQALEGPNTRSSNHLHANRAEATALTGNGSSGKWSTTTDSWTNGTATNVIFCW